MTRLVPLLLAAWPAVAFAQDGAINRGAWSLLAPVVAIGLALATRKVIPSLAAGVVTAGLVASGLDVIGATEIIVVGVAEVVTDMSNLKIALFTLLVAGAVGVLTRSGAMRSMVGRFEGLAKGRRGAMIATWLAGAVVFFDDYANCLVVGNSMQSVVDRFKVSRAKLAYIVDATAAPVASLAVVSTWVGYQVSVIEKGLSPETAHQAFAIFVASIPYSFYSWFTLAFVGAIAISGRDFGPMLRAERNVGPPVDAGPTSDSPVAWWLAPIAIGLLVVVTFTWMIGSGVNALGDDAAGAAMFEILEASSTYDAMILGSLVALVVACGAVAVSPGVPTKRIAQGLQHGIAPVLHALVILFLAWTLTAAIKETGAQAFLGNLVSENLDPRLLPSISFVLAAGTAFATGSSYSTMAILVPLAVGIGVTVTGDVMHPITLGATASILAGSCLGDHASPISDTTVLSSIGSGVDLVTHVRTQLPYVLTVGIVSLVLGFIPAGFGVSPWLLLPVGAAVCVAIVGVVGQDPEDVPEVLVVPAA